MATAYSGDQITTLDQSNDRIRVNEEVLETNIPYSKNANKAQDEILLEPFTYLLRKKGKDIRPKLLKAFNVWLNVPDEKVKMIGDIIQTIN